MTEGAGLIPPGYLFSQHSLNTYLRCPRRFLLKYVEQQPWPMPAEEDPLDYEAHLARGRILHHWLARQHLGLEMESIVAATPDPSLRAWWLAAQRFERAALPQGLREAELPVVVPLGEYRLYARYDYLALDPGGDAVIVDWKTLETRPSAQVLRQRIQTRVYLYTLIAAGHVLTGGAPIAPERAAMLYWFANFPDEPFTVRYSAQAYARDAQQLRALVAEIVQRPREAFQRTEDTHLCARCNYRSLCGRESAQAAPGAEDWLDEDIDFNLELEEIQELEY
jgi:CRISPR/Cas system-associated exonuclease Cas4 (RecB family)